MIPHNELTATARSIALVATLGPVSAPVTVRSSQFRTVAPTSRLRGFGRFWLLVPSKFKLLPKFSARANADKRVVSTWLTLRANLVTVGYAIHEPRTDPRRA